MKVKLTLLFFLISSCISCSLFDSSSEQIIGRYFVLWIDLPTSHTVSLRDSIYSSSFEPIVPQYVFAVGHNKKYIIAKQHPTRELNGRTKVKTNITNYYIIDMQKNHKTFGPLPKQKFDSFRLALKIQNIPFDKTYLDSP